MNGPPLPEPVARRARTYLASLVPVEETSDAWHELVADATYWGEREELPVLRLAHQVVLQHQRVTQEVATLALDEMGITSPVAVAQVLDVAEADARALRERVTETIEEANRASPVHVFDAEVGAVGTRTDPDPGDGDEVAEDVRVATVDDADVAATGRDLAAAPGADEPSAAPARDEAPSGTAVRIGFEEDDVIEVDAWEDPEGLGSRRWAAVAAIAVAALVLLWLLVG